MKIRLTERWKRILSVNVTTRKEFITSYIIWVGGGFVIALPLVLIFAAHVPMAWAVPIGVIFGILGGYLGGVITWLWIGALGIRRRR